MLTAEQIESVTHLQLPARVGTTNSPKGLHIRQHIRNVTVVEASIEAFRSRGPEYRRLRADIDGQYSVVIELASVRDDYGDEVDEVWRCKQARVEAGLLILDKPEDRRPIDIGGEPSAYERVREAWLHGIRYQHEVRDANAEFTIKGFRRAQLGALHAIASHWTVSKKPATVVMPTGTGKTEVMMAAAIANRASRVLIVVPSDALRFQTALKFGTYGVLREINAVDEDLPGPVCGILSSQPTENHLESLAQCNVVVATMSSIARSDVAVQRQLAELFSHVFFDEAHHKEAGTWKRFYDNCEGCLLLLLTATPFRQDGKPIGGKFIYTFPLHQAQQDGYFKPIHFKEVFEPDETLSDSAIAAAAVEQLQEDLKIGLDHIMMARADTIERARALFENIYQSQYTALNPVLIHSQTPRKGAVLERIRNNEHKIIVCVDMFGEGFDLPMLKIAALHVPHKSLGVSLQFIGRFARSTRAVGDATFVANLANDGVPEALDSLYQEDADWNEIVSDLSYDAIDPHARLSDLVDNLQDVGESDEDIQISNLTLRPKISAQVYRVSAFFPHRFSDAFNRNQHVVQPQISQQDNMLILIVNQQEKVEWTDSRDISLDTWDLYLAYYNPEINLLYTYCSRRGTATGRFANAISDDPVLIRDEDVFKTFTGLRRLVLHSVGLTGRSRNVRYQMFAGLDVRDAVNPVLQNDKLKSNITGVGYENGERTNVGCSRKGKIWSMQSGSIAQWRNWCDRIGAKLVNSANDPQEFLRYTLVPETIERCPHEVALMVDWPDQLFASFSFRFDLYTPSGQFCYDDCEIALHSWEQNGNRFEFEVLAAEERRALLALTLTTNDRGDSDFQVELVEGIGVEVATASGRSPVADYFGENPPLVRLADGSQMAGNILLRPQEALGDTFDSANIQTLDWQSTDIRVESRWRNGESRQGSIQERFMRYLLHSTTASFIVDDDDSGESADVVAIEEQDNAVIVYLWHCKYSSGDEPGHRASDLYTVCGQAQKSAKWTWNLNNLVKHLARRETELLRGRDTRFLRGTLQELFSLRKSARLKFVSYKIGIVQPGLSKSEMPEEHLAILGATNSFVQCVTDSPLLVYASE